VAASYGDGCDSHGVVWRVVGWPLEAREAWKRSPGGEQARSSLVWSGLPQPLKEGRDPQTVGTPDRRFRLTPFASPAARGRVVDREVDGYSVVAG
jgi:hypothetical protein